MSAPDLRRGVVFRAEHDASFDFWGSEEPRAKLCLTFNASPPEGEGNVHYFLATSKVTKYREMPSLLSDMLIFPPETYSFFPDETLIDFRTLCVAPLPKLICKRLAVVGELSEDHIKECEGIVATARILENRMKKLLGLR